MKSVASTLDVLETRSGTHPRYVLTIPTNNHQQCSIKRRSQIPDEEWNRKKINSALGDAVIVAPPAGQQEEELYVPVERRFDSVALAWHLIYFSYPVYAEWIHHKLRRPLIECPDGWYSLLRPIADNHSKMKARYILSSTSPGVLCWDDVVSAAVASWETWFNTEGKLWEKGQPDMGFFAAFRKTITVVEVSVVNAAVLLGITQNV